MPNDGSERLAGYRPPSIESRASWVAAGITLAIPSRLRRDALPSSEASWRVPLVLFTAMSGMAFGSWFAGALHDHFGYYGPAFGSGVPFNTLNLALVGFLAAHQSRWGFRLGEAVV